MNLNYKIRKTHTIETRKRDYVIRIADWTRESIKTGEPAYDVEIYNKGIYDWDESKSFTLRSGLTKQEAKRKAVEFTKRQLEKFLREK